MTSLLKGILLTAALTPLCWIVVLIALRRVRQTGLAGSGPNELLDQLERYAWAAGVFLALLLSSVLA